MRRFYQDEAVKEGKYPPMKKISLTMIMACVLLFENHLYGQWVQTNGPCEGRVFSLALSTSGAIYAGTEEGVFLSTNSGSSWTNADSGLPNAYVLSFAESRGDIFAGTDSGVYLSFSNSTSWFAVNSGLTNPAVRSLSAIKDNIFAGTDGGVYRSFQGLNWTAVDNGLPTNSNVYSLAVGDSFTIFAGTDKGAFLSADNGDSWIAVSSGLWDPCVLSLAVSGNTIFAGTKDGVFRSADNGTSWNAVNASLRGIFVTTLAVSGINVFAGSCFGGLYLSNDNGTNWTAVHSGFPTNTKVYSLAVKQDSVNFLTIYVGTDCGVWRRPLSEMLEIANPCPRRGIKTQAHFRIVPLSRSGSKVSVEFSIPHSEYVAVTVYDMPGKKIASLVNRQHDAGSYKYSWDTHAFARGCYALRLQAGANNCMKLIQIVN
jgi:ligand-binding sensor domain-containing protein